MSDHEATYRRLSREILEVANTISYVRGGVSVAQVTTRYFNNQRPFNGWVTYLLDASIDRCWPETWELYRETELGALQATLAYLEGERKRLRAVLE